MALLLVLNFTGVALIVASITGVIVHAVRIDRTPAHGLERFEHLLVARARARAHAAAGELRKHAPAQRPVGVRALQTN